MEKAKHNTRQDTRMKIKYKKPKTRNKNKTNRRHDRTNFVAKHCNVRVEQQVALKWPSTFCRMGRIWPHATSLSEDTHRVEVYRIFITLTNSSARLKSCSVILWSLKKEDNHPTQNQSSFNEDIKLKKYFVKIVIMSCTFHFHFPFPLTS